MEFLTNRGTGGGMDWIDLDRLQEGMLFLVIWKHGVGSGHVGD